MSCAYKEDKEHRLIELTVDGRVSEADFDEIAARLAAFIGDHGQVKILEIVKSFNGMDLAAIPKGVMFDLRHMKDFSHGAVVTDSGWIGKAAEVEGALIPGLDIEAFGLDEVAKAEAWLAA